MGKNPFFKKVRNVGYVISVLFIINVNYIKDFMFLLTG